MASIRKTKKGLKKHQLFEVCAKGYRGVVVTQFDDVDYLKNGIVVKFSYMDTFLFFLPFTKIGAITYYNINES